MSTLGGSCVCRLFLLEVELWSWTQQTLENILKVGDKTNDEVVQLEKTKRRDVG